MPIKPLNFKIPFSAFQKTDSQSVVSDDIKAASSKAKEVMSSEDSKDPKQKESTQKIGSNIPAKSLAKYASNRITLGSSLLLKNAETHNNTTAIKNTGTARNTDSSKVQRSIIKPTYNPESDLDPDIETALYDALTSLRNIDKTSVIYDQHSEKKLKSGPPREEILRNQFRS